MQEKKINTEQDCKDLQEWFKKQDLPAEMWINEATYSPDLRATVDMLLEQAFICKENPKMYGCFYLLEAIREKLQK